MFLSAHILYPHWIIKHKFTKLTSQHAPCATRGEQVLPATSVLQRCWSGGQWELSGLGRMNRYWVHMETGNGTVSGRQQGEFKHGQRLVHVIQLLVHAVFKKLFMKILALQKSCKNHTERSSYTPSPVITLNYPGAFIKIILDIE